MLAQNGDASIQSYWQRASPVIACPKWIARWFLYHMFRHRDHRQRVKDKVQNNDHNPYWSVFSTTLAKLDSAQAPCTTSKNGYDKSEQSKSGE
jgi:hypothetical protein